MDIVHSNDHGFLLDVDHLDVLHVDLFHDAAPSQGTLEADAYIGINEGAVPDHNIPNASGHLASDHKAAVTLSHFAVMDQHILAGRKQLSGFPVFSRL